MIRSNWKGKFVPFDILKENLYEDSILLNNTNVFLLQEFIGLKFYVYNGYSWSVILIDSTMIRYNLGCFLSTRKMGVTHNLKKMKKILNKKSNSKKQGLGKILKAVVKNKQQKNVEKKKKK